LLHRRGWGKRRWIFTLAIQRVQLDMLGVPSGAPSNGATVAKGGIETILRRILKTLTPAELQAVSSRWTPKVIGDADPHVDPKRADQVAADGESAARALLKEYVSAERAEAYDSAPMLQQADMLLEAGATVVRSRGWPTAYILYLNDTSDGYQGRQFVRRFIGNNSAEDLAWPTMTDRQRGAAVKKGVLAAFDLSRQLAQSKVDVAEWLRRAGVTKDPFADPEDRILLAGGRKLLERYRQAPGSEQREIVIAATLKAQGWLWTLQGAL